MSKMKIGKMNFDNFSRQRKSIIHQIKNKNKIFFLRNIFYKKKRNLQ